MREEESRREEGAKEREEREGIVRGRVAERGRRREKSGVREEVLMVAEGEEGEMKLRGSEPSGLPPTREWLRGT